MKKLILVRWAWWMLSQKMGVNMEINQWVVYTTTKWTLANLIRLTLTSLFQTCIKGVRLVQWTWIMHSLLVILLQWCLVDLIRWCTNSSSSNTLRHLRKPWWASSMASLPWWASKPSLTTISKVLIRTGTITSLNLRQRRSEKRRVIKFQEWEASSKITRDKRRKLTIKIVVMRAALITISDEHQSYWFVCIKK